MQIAEVGFCGVYSGPSDITQPSDSLIASSANSPGSEGEAMLLTAANKIFTFDGKNSQPSGFVVTPSRYDLRYWNITAVC